MPQFEFAISLSSEEVRTIYEGQTRFVLVKTNEGLKLQLPAINFRQYVTKDGIHGRFRLSTDANNRLQRLVKL